ncbi:hypothetical protein BASA81_009911 [Batrachochytrium salamandrivorans]|nr:hypothetical protein BASA81_009911 [Batrachochytrium salamandrivorans]
MGPEEWQCKLPLLLLLIMLRHSMSLAVLTLSTSMLFLMTIPTFLELERTLACSSRNILPLVNTIGAGWVDLVTDENGLPTKWNGRYRLASGKVDGLQSEENWQVREVPDRASNPLARQAVQPNDTLALALGLPVGTTVYQASTTEPHGIHKSNMNPSTNRQTVHSMQAVDLYCHGPWEWRLHCAKPMDNTELFFIMAEALGLGSEKC